MRTLAVAGVTIIALALSSPLLAEDLGECTDPLHALTTKSVEQALVGAGAAIAAGGEHLPGPHIGTDAKPGTYMSNTDMVALSAASAVLNAMGQAWIGENAPLWQKMGVSFGSTLFTTAFVAQPHLAVAGGVIESSRTALGSKIDEEFKGDRMSIVAVRAAVSGMGNASLAGTAVAVLVVLGAPIEITAMGPAMLAAGGIAFVSTWVSRGTKSVPCPLGYPTCKVGKETITQMKYQMETARQSGKSFNYDAAQGAMNSAMIKVTSLCEAEAVGPNPDSARACAEQKDILKNFRGTVETACKTDPTWCALSKTTLHRVEAKTNEVCERERVANKPRAPRTKTTKRAPEPVYAQPQPGPSAADVATAVIIGAGIASGIAGRSRGPVAQPPRGPAQPQGCHRGPDGRIHCGRN